MKSGWVDVVGILDDGPASLTPAALAVVRGAGLLVGGERHLTFFSDHSAERLAIKGSLAALAERLRLELGRRRVVVLASGDPLFFGIGSYLIHRLGKEAVRVHPNVSAMALAFARAGESWHDAVLASVHGRDPAGVAGLVRGQAKVGLFTDPVNTPGAIARLLLDAGIAGYTAYVGENLAGTAERVVKASLADLPAMSFAALNVLILVREEECP